MKNANEDKNAKPSEPLYAVKPLSRNKFGIGYFHAQIFLFIPLPIYNALGADKIHALAIDVYKKVRLDIFRGSSGLYQNSYFMELPPSRNLLKAFLNALRDATAKHDKNRSLKLTDLS